MSVGWIKLHRKLLDSRVFANEGLLRVWIYCLCRANHEINYVDIVTGKGKTEVKVGPGEFIFGRKSVANDLNMNPSTLYKRVQKLKSIGNINIQSNTHYSIVSICNWDTYQNKEFEKEQAKEHPSNTQVTGKEHPSNTDKNDNNVKNDNKYTIPTREDVEEYFKEQDQIPVIDIPLEAKKFINHYEEEEWKTSKGKRIKNWHRQAGTWTANYKQWNRGKKNGHEKPIDRTKRHLEQTERIFND